MAKVIFHIGTHKTASTTIQDTFWWNNALLEEHGLAYPRLSHVTGHHGLLFDWFPLAPAYRYDCSSRDMFQSLAEKYVETDKTLFLSSEEFSRGTPERQIDFSEVRALFKDFESVEIICLLRPQWQLLQSIYLEISKKSGRIERPPKVVEQALSTGLFHGLWIDYTRLLDQLLKAFSPEEITFVDFASATKSDGGILGWLLRHLDIQLKADALEPVNDGRSNVSPKPLASWGANILAEPRTAPPWLIELVEEAIEKEFGSDRRQCLFTRGEFDRLQTHFDACNAKLNERLRTSQPGFSMTMASCDNIDLFREDIPGRFWLLPARLLVKQQLTMT
ncbi:MAG: hypothetical protein AAGG57_16620 [Pseudomonadota bacterium]